MKVVGILCLVAGMMIVAGCDETPKIKIKNPMAGYNEALDKARAVEGQLLEAAEKQRKAIDEMSK